MMLALDMCYILCCWYSYSDSNSDNNYLSIKINQEMSNLLTGQSQKEGTVDVFIKLKEGKSVNYLSKRRYSVKGGEGALREYTARSSSMGWHCRISDEKETQHFSYMSNKYILPFSCHR